MLNVLRFSGVLKKLQLNDLTKYLIGRLAAIERTLMENHEINQTKLRECQPNKIHQLQTQQQKQLFHQEEAELSKSHSSSTLLSTASPSSLSSKPARITTTTSTETTTTGTSSLSKNFHSSRKSTVAASASSSVGLAFGNRSTLTDLAATARVHQQQTVVRELEENIENCDCDKVGKMSTENHHSEASALKAGTAISSDKESSCPAASSPADIIKFLELVGDLKHMKRTGWVMRDVKDCESISGHMYRMGMMTYLLDGKDGLDRTKCLELAMVHDLAECVVGDLTPFCGVSREEKKLRELRAMEDICKLIQPYGQKVLELFQEYENAETPESKFVKDLDRLDMVLQAFEYEKRDNCVLKHQEFFDSTDGKFGHPRVRQLIDEINAQRRVLAAEKEQRNNIVVNGNCSNSNSEMNGFTRNGHQEDDVSDVNISGAKKMSTS